MLQCWNANPLERPSFTELAEQLGDMLDDNIRRVSGFFTKNYSGSVTFLCCFIVTFMIFAQILDSLYIATDSTQHRPCKPNRSSVIWVILYLVWNLKVHITMFRGLPLILNLNQINLVYSSCSVSVIFISILSSRCICLWLCLPSSLCSSGVPTQIPYTFLSHACHVPKCHL
jgi:hypothetical protein